MVWFRAGYSVGGTPTDAVETTALPAEPLLIWGQVNWQGRRAAPTGRRSAASLPSPTGDLPGWEKRRGETVLKN